MEFQLDKRHLFYLNIAGEYLEGRSWAGLEQDLGQTPVEKAKLGRKGIAMRYDGENT